MRIIIADDDPLVVDMLSDYLEGAGHTIERVYDGSALMKELMETPPDLVISDIDMPGIRGESAQAMIENYPALKEIPFIVVTGTPKERVYALGLSPDTIVLSKPVDFSALDEAVKKFQK